MKVGRTLQQLATEIERQRTSKNDIIVDTRSLTMGVGTGMMGVIPLQSLPMRALAHKQLADKLDIPNKYYERMRTDDPELLSRNVNTWLHKQPERRMIRMLDGSIRAFLSDKYQRIDNHDVAEVALPLLGRYKMQIRSCEITEHKLYIKATSPMVKAKVTGSKRKGDIVECGVMVTNSEVGKGAISVKPFYHFLACVNGMVGLAVMRAAHLGGRQDELEDLLTEKTKRAEDNLVLMKLKDVINGVMDEKRFKAEIARMSEATKDKITGDPVAAIQVLGDAAGLDESEGSSVLRHLIEGGDLSRYGLMNAVTRTAEDVADYDRATELEEEGGKLLLLTGSRWREIAQAQVH